MKKALKYLKKFNTGAVIAIFLFVIFGSFQNAQAGLTQVSVTVLPAAPENAAVFHTSLTEVNLSWDASPSLVSDIASYTVFYKETTDPDYPLIPQITRVDSLANYSELISVTANTAYDFIIYANTISGLTSIENCASCSVTSSLSCGNGLIDVGEDCDGANLGGSVCTDFGYISGTLGCSAICQFDYGSCQAVDSGGGGGGNIDQIDPNPGTADSPEYANSSPFTVTYSGAYDTGGSGFSYLELYSKKGTGTFLATGLTSAETTGSFAFVPDSDLNATYSFGLRAWDNEGNSTLRPQNNGDTTTIYDAELPGISTIEIPGESTGMVNITYEGAVDAGLAGLDKIELWYRQGIDGEWIDTGMTATGNSGQFNFDVSTGSDDYYFDLIAVDNAGNRSIENDEYLTPVVVDMDAPIVDVTSIGFDKSGEPIVISYNGAVDIGSAGFKQVNLWYRKGEQGIWTDTGQTKTTTDGIFEYISTEDGIYFFDIVLLDNFGNSTDKPNANDNGIGSVIFSIEPLVANLSELPDSITYRTDTDIRVTGEDVTVYKYRLDDGEFGDEISVDDNIVLEDLSEGDHEISVIAGNALGQWQDSSSPTAYSWTIDFSQPMLIISGPSPTELISNETAIKEVTYSITYMDVDNVTLSLDDITLNTSGSATGNIQLENVADFIRLVRITGITGVGTLSITISANTASHNNGNFADEEGPGKPVIVAVFTAEEGEVIGVVEFDQLIEEVAEELGDEVAQTLKKVAQDDGKKPSKATQPKKKKVSKPVIEETEFNIEPITPLSFSEISAVTSSVFYSDDEIVENAVEVIKSREPVTETVFTVSAPAAEPEVISIIDECKSKYPNIDFTIDSLDSDEDGLTNRTECYASTNPEQADTDEDSCSDGDEINFFATNPLDPTDCRAEEKLKKVAISSPQAGWLVSKLEIMGLTSDETSVVNMIAFPVEDGIASVDDVIEIGSVNKFAESSIENNYYFEAYPKNNVLNDGQTYDLVAISILQDGEILSSDPIRFTMDSGKETAVPVPISIGDVSLAGDLKLENIRIRASENGKVEIVGESEYGSQIFAVWQSVVLASSVIADSKLGGFAVESPMSLETGEDHRVTLYAVKSVGDQKLRSQNVEIRFYMQKPMSLLKKIIMVTAVLLFGLGGITYSLKYSTKSKKLFKLRKRR